ncbi:MAG: hypothetical protein V2B19_26735 [Pseudomonadota bacterium]
MKNNEKNIAVKSGWRYRNTLFYPTGRIIALTGKALFSAKALF